MGYIFNFEPSYLFRFRLRKTVYLFSVLMKKFIKHILFFLILSFLFFELIVRIFDLTNDVPKRNLIQEKYQVYKKNQLGIYKDAEWKVNEFGFLGLCEIGVIG